LAYEAVAEVQAYTFVVHGVDLAIFDTFFLSESVHIRAANDHFPYAAVLQLHHAARLSVSEKKTPSCA
jgi:hypothetical protein